MMTVVNAIANFLFLIIIVLFVATGVIDWLIFIKQHLVIDWI